MPSFASKFSLKLPLLLCLFCGGLYCGKDKSFFRSPDQSDGLRKKRSASLYEKIDSEPLTSAFQLPLRSKGRWIVDQQGKRVKLASVNWYGASDVYSIPSGLDFASISSISNLIKSIGFNSVRLPFSNQMLYETEAVMSDLVKANPRLKGMAPLKIFDAVINGLSKAGLMVILNNHTTIGKWCCNRNDGNGLWFNSFQTAEDWKRDWEFIVDRYRNNPMVVAVDLRNELREDFFSQANWGSGDAYDYLAVGLDIGKRLLQVKPELLLIFEGLDFSFDFYDMAKKPAFTEAFSERLVYSPHLYAWFRDRSGRLLTEFNDYQDFERALDMQWGHFLDADAESVPLWIGEFGYSSIDQSEEQKNYRQWVLRYLQKKDIDFSWWPLNGGFKPGSNERESWGLLNDHWNGVKDEDPRIEEIQRLIKPHLGPLGVASHLIDD